MGACSRNEIRLFMEIPFIQSLLQKTSLRAVIPAVKRSPQLNSLPGKDIFVSSRIHFSSPSKEALNAGNSPEDKQAALNIDLIEAAANGDTKAVKSLLDSGAQIHARDINQRTVFHQAAMNGHVETVNLLVQNMKAREKTSLLNLKDSYEDTPLLYAAAGGHTEIMKTLLANCADLSVLDSSKRTVLSTALFYSPLNKVDSVHFLLKKIKESAGLSLEEGLLDRWIGFFLAVKKGEIKEVSHTLEKSISVNVRSPDKLGWTALHLAAKWRKIEMLKHLLTHGAQVVPDHFGNTVLHDIAEMRQEEQTISMMSDLLHFANLKPDIFNLPAPNGKSALQIAASLGNDEIAKLLRESIAEIEGKDSSGATALHRAVRAGDVTKVKFLVGKGSDIEARDKLNGSPLHWAVFFEKKDIIATLLQNHASIESKDLIGDTPLMIAVKHRDLEAVRILIENGAVINYQNLEDDTPLLIAIKDRYLDGLNILVENGADTKAKDSRGWAPLHHAAGPDMGNIDIIKSLLAHDADIEATDPQGNTPLQHAIWNENNGIIQILVRHGANVEARALDGYTPLMTAVMKRNFDAVKILVEKCGADVRSVNTKGESALNIARQGYSEVIANYLEVVVNDLESEEETKHIPTLRCDPAVPGTLPFVHSKLSSPNLETMVLNAVRNKDDNLRRFLMDNEEVNRIKQYGIDKSAFDVAISHTLRNKNTEVLQFLLQYPELQTSISDDQAKKMWGIALSQKDSDLMAALDCSSSCKLPIMSESEDEPSESESTEIKDQEIKELRENLRNFISNPRQNLPPQFRQGDYSALLDKNFLSQVLEAKKTKMSRLEEWENERMTHLQALKNIAQNNDRNNAYREQKLRNHGVDQENATAINDPKKRKRETSPSLDRPDFAGPPKKPRR